MLQIIYNLHKLLLVVALNYSHFGSLSFYVILITSLLNLMISSESVSTTESTSIINSSGNVS